MRLMLVRLGILTDIIQYVYHCTLLQLLTNLLRRFLGISNQVTMKSPGFENGNLDRPKPGMLIPNMCCTFVQIHHHDLVPFSALQINDLFLWSVGINLYHNKAHITKLFRTLNGIPRGVGILDTSILRVSIMRMFMGV